MRHRATPARTGWAAALALALSPWAAAAGLEVAIVDTDGAPVPDAVVMLLPHAGLDTGPGVSRTHTVDQHDLQFDPHVTLLHPGDRVVFRNSDRTRHHVYSFSTGGAFETIVKPGESSPPMAFAQRGPVSVGCNIHDRMIAYLYVTDAPFAERTGTSGLAHFANVPAGAWTVRVWQPRSKAEKQTSEQEMAMPAADGSRLRVVLSLRPDARRAHDRESATY